MSTHPIPARWRLADHTISREDLAALADWLGSDPWLAQGKLVADLERRWSERIGVRGSVMVNSGSSANLAALVAAGRAKPGPLRVGAPAVARATTISPALLLGHEVVLFDVDRTTLGIDSAAACAAMERGEIDVLFVVHLLGLNALTPDLVATAARHGVILLEDCCEAAGTRFADAHVGTAGLAGTFSFYFGQHVATVEGGMVSSDDPEVLDGLRLLRSHGLAGESEHFDRFAADHPDVDPRFLFMVPGLNLRSTDLNALLGLRQLDRLDGAIRRRNANLAHFLRVLPPYLWRDYATEGASSFTLPLIAEDTDGARRARSAAERLGIEARPIVAGNLLAQPFVRTSDRVRAAAPTPVADHVHRHGFYIGNGPHVSAEMLDALGAALR
ncbi:DegT/DnrJ/EryC1/StrS family aminotransferase [Streptomyces johnsoniae]|uniref:DegT/DnrJ/EryC1/StrS family aminotransferase n=1 Tax=Streptomyces johnsoniae TaxID=3075532 RepID=A0ABU2S509_9ACTN|nr:DegT/DnrJ/EryC1/StrS family aminotransferase [Streptomyces sp. DSM 41886]MDT0442710.1 DegT/DnrJ/EryC1/StrS family aminotransferase [Streptomyces sp. DSM 41886]